MDFFPIIFQAFSHFWYLVPLVIVILVLKSSWFKGKLGEAYVNRLITTNLNAGVYHLIRNVTLPAGNGTTQLDHIIVSIYGIFVIETKNMKGWIFGDKNQSKWTQQIYNYKNRFQNPLRQNYKHTKTLEKLLGITEKKLHSVIVFTGDNKFKTKMPPEVTRGKEFVNYIKSKNTPLLSDEEVSDVISTITSGRLEPSFKTDWAHVQYLNNKFDNPKKLKSSLTTRLIPAIIIFVIILISGKAILGVLENMGKAFQKNSQEIGQNSLEKVRQQQLIRQRQDIKNEALWKQQLEIKMQKLLQERENSWDKHYKEPKDCLSYKSDAHMVECANRRIRAKREFFKLSDQDRINPGSITQEIR